MSAIKSKNDHRAAIETDTLCNYLRAVSAIVDEARLEISDDGWYIEAVDPANVVAGYFELPAKDFQEFKLARSDITIGVGVSEILAAIETLPETQETHLGVNRNEERVELATAGYEYSLEYVDPDNLRSGPGEMDDFSSISVRVKCTELKSAVEYLDEVVKNVWFEYEAGSTDFWVNGHDDRETGSVYLDLVSERPPEGGKSLYSLDYHTADMVASIPEGAEVTIEFGDQTPYRLRYGLGDEGTVEFNQAPRIVGGE